MSTKLYWNTSLLNSFKICSYSQLPIYVLRITVIDKELEEWRFRAYQLEEENQALSGRDAHLREECAESMKRLVTSALQFDKENVTYPKIGREEVSFSFVELLLA